MKCLVKCKGNVTSFLAQSELLDLCEKVLRVSTGSDEITIYQNILVGVL